MIRRHILLSKSTTNILHIHFTVKKSRTIIILCKKRVNAFFIEEFPF